MPKTEKPKAKNFSKKKSKLRKNPPIKRESTFFKFTGLDGKQYSLNKQQKLFVEKYLEFGASGVSAVIAAGYDVQFKKDGKPTGSINYKMAAVISSVNLIKVNICAYRDTLLKQYGYDDDNVERQHLFVLNQSADLSNKMKAISEYYKLKGKYKPEEKVITHKLTDDELKRILSD